MDVPHERDAYGRISYRSLIDWSPRLEREAPFLARQLETAPSRRLVDLGCGTGEHAVHFATRGWEVVGLDHSEDQIEAARQHERAGLDLRFRRGSLRDLPSLEGEAFGAALCLGNVLPSLDEEELEASFEALARSLRPGAPVVLQLLNTDRLRRVPVRHLPLNFRPDPEGGEGDEIVFLRLLRPEGPDHISFRAVTLALPADPEADLGIRESTRVRWRAWSRDELDTRLRAAGFEELRAFGDMLGGPFDVRDSHDLVLVATRGKERD